MDSIMLAQLFNAWVVAFLCRKCAEEFGEQVLREPARVYPHCTHIRICQEDPSELVSICQLEGGGVTTQPQGTSQTGMEAILCLHVPRYN